MPEPSLLHSTSESPVVIEEGTVSQPDITDSPALELPSSASGTSVPQHRPPIFTVSPPRPEYTGGTITRPAVPKAHTLRVRREITGLRFPVKDAHLDLPVELWCAGTAAFLGDGVVVKIKFGNNSQVLKGTMREAVGRDCGIYLSGAHPRGDLPKPVRALALRAYPSSSANSSRSSSVASSVATH